MTAEDHQQAVTALAAMIADWWAIRSHTITAEHRDPPPDPTSTTE